MALPRSSRPFDPSRRRLAAGGLAAAAWSWLAAPGLAGAQPAAPAGGNRKGSCPAVTWPLWQAFASHYLQADGRIVDYSVPQMHSTSEGQSYGMFFALVANDPAAFERIWRWSVLNLAGGNLSARLPAWQWGRREDGNWGVLDPNAASDADLWFAYALLEAARIWKKPQYRDEASVLLARVQRDEVVNLPGLGQMLLPGPQGFNLPGGVWRLNASYLMVPQLRRFATEDPSGPWAAIARNSLRVLAESPGKGYVADWIGYQVSGSSGGRFIVDPGKGSVGSYDAIRSYLWAGVTSAADPLFADSLKALDGMRAALVTSGGLPPEKVDVTTGQTTGTGPLGFSAVLLPLSLIHI